MGLSFDSALHGRCDRAPVGQGREAWTCAWRDECRHRCAVSDDLVYILNLYTLAGELCVYVSRGMGYRQPSVCLALTCLGSPLGSGKQCV